MVHAAKSSSSWPARAGLGRGGGRGPRSKSASHPRGVVRLAEEFLAYQATINKPTELVAKQMILRVHLIPAFGNRRLDQIDERMIDAYKVVKLEQPSVRGKPLNPKTINHHLKLLGRMFRVARKWKLITEVPEIGLLKLRKSDFDFLDFDEAEALIAGAAKHSSEWHPFVVVAIRTGLRIGELIALRWREDIDLERGRLRYAHLAHGIGDDLIRRLAPARDAAQLQHKSGPQERPISKSAPHTL